MRCPYCREEIPNRVEKCPACGADLELRPVQIPLLGDADPSTLTAISIVLILGGLAYIILQAIGIIPKT